MTQKELLKSDEFRKQLESNIAQFENRPALPAGQKYKRTPYDELKDKGLLTFRELRKEYVRIMAKDSTLSSSQRKAVKDIVNGALFAAYSEIVKRERQTEAQKQAEQKHDAQQLAAGIAPQTNAVVPKRKRKKKEA